jgi:hypothetical protein
MSLLLLVCFCLMFGRVSDLWWLLLWWIIFK